MSNAKNYVLKEPSPGTGVPRAWRTRPDAEHPKGQLVTATQPGVFDLDEYFPETEEGTDGREWFAEYAPPASGAPAAAPAAAPAKASGGKGK